MNLATFLVGLVGPMAARFLTSMGLTLVTLTGMLTAWSSLKTTITSSIGGLPSAAVQLGGLLGLWECMGLVFGAITFVLTWQSTKGFWALVKA